MSHVKGVPKFGPMMIRRETVISLHLHYYYHFMLSSHAALSLHAAMFLHVGDAIHVLFHDILVLALRPYPVLISYPVV